MAQSSSIVANIKTSDDEVQDIFKLLKSGDENIQLSRYKDVVLILGNTGAGKSTLAHFITGNGRDLISEEEGEGEFIIRDMNNKVSNSTLLSKTLYPDRIVDPVTRTIYYDCPGFIDTRSPAHDISATYFVKKVIDFASKVKLVFVVNYHAVRKGVDRNDFLLLVCQASNLLSNIEKFKNSIALIVTKVDNIYKRKGRQHYLVPDKAVTASIVEFLQNAKEDIKKMSSASSTSHKQRCYNSATKFIDILLESDSDNYKRIGLFRRPDESGPLSDIELLQEEKAHIKNIINTNIIFSNKHEGDFGYSVSDQSLNYIHDLGDKINESVGTELMKIGEEIKAFFEFEEKQTIDIYSLYDKFKSGQRLLSKLEMKDIVQKGGFLQDIVNGINDLGITISQDNILNIVNYLSYLKFLNDVSKRSTTNPLIWSQGLDGIKRYLISSQKWYNFLINLNSWLSEYTIHQNITEYWIEARQIIKLYPNNQNKEIHLSELNINLFLEKIKIKSLEHNIINSYNDIKDLIINYERLEALKRVLNLTINNKDIETICEKPNKLVIKGHFLKLSEVDWKKDCPHKVEFIELFATNKVFIDIDVNKTGEILGMSIMSPVWDVIGSRKIVLDGKLGDALEKADNGYFVNARGEDGKPGLPGGAAGTFLGIAGEVNGGQLTVSAIGGRGGPGQEGGDGAPGKRGNDAPDPNRTSAFRTIFNQWGPDKDWNAKQVNWDHRKNKEEYLVLAYHYYKAYGTKASNGGDGGNGGIGGLGGNPGDIKIIDVKNSGKISILVGKGADGVEGKGGKGGTSAENGYTYSADCKTVRPVLFAYTSCKNILREPAGSSSSGDPGLSGIVKSGRKEPEHVVEYVKPSHSVNSYKNYLRKNFVNSIQRSQLATFLRNFENTEVVKHLYDTLGLLNELQGLENDYRNSKENMPELQSYESLLTRIHSYAMNPKKMEKNLQYKKVLAYLYTATLSKLYCSNINVKNYMILDIPKYLDIVVESIETLKTLKNNDAINKHKQQYTNQIKSLITNANDILKQKAIPEIKNIFKDVDKKIQLLINDTLSTIQETEDRKEDFYKRQEALEQSIFMKLILYPINIVGDFLGFLGPAVEDIMQIISGVNSIIEPLNLGGLISDNSVLGSLDQILHVSTTALEKIFEGVNEEGKGKAQLLTAQLQDIGLLLHNILGLETKQNPKLKDTYDQIINFKDKLNNDLKNNGIIDQDTVEMMRNDAVRKLEAQNETFSISEKHEGVSLDVFKNISQILNVTDISPELYENIRNDSRKLQLVEETLNNLNEKIKKLRIFENNIYRIIIPKCKDLRNILADFKSKVNGKSHPELQLYKWEIQATIKDVKFEIEQLTKTFGLGEALTHCLDKLIEAMAYIINIYDLIDDYDSKVNLASYIAHISSSTAREIKVDGNSELEEAVNELELVIHSNLVLEEYNRAMEAFIQYTFPFAHLYLDEYSLPPSLGLNGTDYLFTVAIEKVKRLRSKIVKSNITTNFYDKHIHKNVNFSSENHMLPFYVWEHSFNRIAIEKLLNGGEIIIKSDIKKGINKNAIKFNVIGINLKAKNESTQINLNRDLENFEVKMKHFGNSHFKCGNKYYVMNSEPLTFKYHLRKNKDGLPIDKNLVYDKVMTNDYQLSPYALWSIQLFNETSNYYLLRKYESEIIDIELVGHGQYIDEGEDDANVCNKRIDEYYKVDETESNLNSISDIMNDLDLNAVSNENIRSKRDTYFPPATSGADRSINFSLINHFCTSVIAGFKVLNYFNPISHVNYWIKGVNNGNENLNTFHLDNIFRYEEQTSSRYTNELLDGNALLSPSNILLWDLVIKKISKKTNKEFQKERMYEMHKRSKEIDECSHRMAFNYYAPPIMTNNNKHTQEPAAFIDSLLKSELNIIEHVPEQKLKSYSTLSNSKYNHLVESQSLRCHSQI